MGMPLNVATGIYKSKECSAVSGPRNVPNEYTDEVVVYALDKDYTRYFENSTIINQN